MDTDDAPALGDDARSRAATALRRFGHALHRHDASDELLLSVARQADEITQRLASQPVRPRDPARMREMMFDQRITEGERIIHFEECVVSGPWNPMGIGVEVFKDGDDAVAEVHLGWAWEGAPGRSHGGIVAAIFDDVLGYLLTFIQQPAYTGELTVRFLAGMPIDQPVRYRARVVRVEGRKIDAEAEAYRVGDDGEALPDALATATARFIAIDDYRP